MPTKFYGRCRELPQSVSAPLSEVGVAGPTAYGSGGMASRRLSGLYGGAQLRVDTYSSDPPPAVYQSP